MEPELECFDAQTRKAADFGELKGGFMSQCSLGMCRLWVLLVLDPLLELTAHRLLDTGHYLLSLLFSHFPDMEVAVGTNGRVWIKADDPRKIIIISRCVEAADPGAGAMGQNQVQSFLQEIIV